MLHLLKNLCSFREKGVHFNNHIIWHLYTLFPTITKTVPSLTNSVATYKLQGWDTSGSLLCTCDPRSYFSLLTHAVRHRKVVYGFLWFSWSETFCLTVATHVLHVVLELIPSKRYTEYNLELSPQSAHIMNKIASEPASPGHCIVGV